MASANPARFFTLLQREFREYKNSLLWTPIASAIILGMLMLGSAILVNRIDMIGNAVLDSVIRLSEAGLTGSVEVFEEDALDGSGEETTLVSVQGINPETGEPETINVEITQSRENGSLEQRITVGGAVSPSEPGSPPAPPAPKEYRVIVQESESEEQWNFSRDWNFDFTPNSDSGGAPADGDLADGYEGAELNIMLSVVHGILTLVLLITSVNYLLSALYDDRKDRSILFWRSMPVSEWEIVTSKLVTALVVAPLIYLAVSLVLQLIYVMLMMWLVWRLDLDPFEVVIGNVDFIHLMIDPISGWVLTALFVAPTYAWFLCASSLAKRSPLLMGITPPIVLMLGEAIIFRSTRLEDSFSRHVPHLSDESALGFYLYGPDWSNIDLMSIASGLLVAAVLIAATVWLRKYRWELS
ncbi:MAG: hypothetical protein AAF680_13245 [Pseudomonadota bacterium]